MRQFLFGVVAVLVVMDLGALVVVETGLFDATAETPHSFPVAWATHTTMIHSVQLRARAIVAPGPFTAAQVAAGARRYQQDCALCHGAPAVDRQPWIRGMNPTPPYLLDTARRWSAPQLYWIIARGVKMTGMPAWDETRSPADIWAVVAFLEALPSLSPADYARLTVAETKEPGVPTPVLSPAQGK
jgi:mono/diheme cytochrome c family protein